MSDVAAIRDRLRTGRLSPSALKVAALLGSAGARELLGEGAPAIDRDIAGWLRDLTADVGAPEVALRVAVAAARHALPLRERRDPGVRPLLDRLDACVAAPTPAAVAALLGGLDEVAQAPGEVVAASRAAAALHADTDQRRALYEQLKAGSTCFLWTSDGKGGSRDLRPDEPRWETAWRRAATELASRAAVGIVEPVRSFARDEGIERRVDVSRLITERLEEVRDAIRDEVLPWLLAREDPLAARVAAR